MAEDVSAGACYLAVLAVDSTFRGRGIGKVLLDFVDEQARLKGCSVSLNKT